MCSSRRTRRCRSICPRIVAGVSRVRQCHDLRCHNAGPDSDNTTNFSVQFVTGAGQLSFRVQLQDYLSLTGPVGSLTEFAGTLAHPILITARIPLSAFGGADLSQVRAVSITSTTPGRMNLYRKHQTIVGWCGNVIRGARGTPTDDSPFAWDTGIDQNAVSSMTVIPSEAVLRNESGVAITLNSNRRFLPAGQIPVLRIGNQEFDISRYSDDGSTNQVTFVLTQSEFASLKQGDRISVEYGGDNGNGWRFGAIDEHVEVTLTSHEGPER